ncbi:hypothetical protein KEM54_003856 [Ascosphaera aggregata]|nr:hypothetical protein KEM54_003856 [Ascosphaera aggregata]
MPTSSSSSPSSPSSPSSSSSPQHAHYQAKFEAPDLEITGDQITIHPSGFISDPTKKDDDIEERKLVRHMARFRENPFEFLKEVSLFVSGTGWRAYDNVIGQPVFYPGFSEKIKVHLRTHPMVKKKITELASIQVDKEEKEALLPKIASGSHSSPRLERQYEIESNLREVVEDTMDNMICKMDSNSFIRGAYFLCTQLLTRAYNNGITLPIVVAGDNLNIPLLGPFLQHAGAMWIRRSFGNDPLYQTMVQSYVDVILQNGYNFECFVEGGRSRTGKLLPPKFGILSFIIDSILSGRVNDAIIVPVSTQYDKVIETESYISELLGQPKKKENLMDLLSSRSVLSLKLGRVDARFHEPWSLRDFLITQLSRIPKTPRSIGDQILPDERARILRTLGYRVLSHINDVSVIMPSALVGTVLLTLRGRGVGKTELVRRVDWLANRVKAKGGRVAHFYRNPTEQVVERALEALGPKLVGEVGGLAEPTYYAVDRFQLSFYRNMTIHLFITEALVSVALYASVKQGGVPQNQQMKYEDLWRQVDFLSTLFRGEFIFPPGGLATNLPNTISLLENDNVIEVIRDERDIPTVVGLSKEERLRGRENFDFYCFLVWPFVEATWLGALSVMGLTPMSEEQSPWVDMKKAQDNAQLLGKTLYHQGDLSYFEAVNKETLKNAYQRFQEEGIIQVIKGKERRGDPTVARIAPAWMPERDVESKALLARGRLWDFLGQISHSRREGKNRRDGLMISIRVLALSDFMGRKVFAASEGLRPRTEQVTVVKPPRPAMTAIESKL